MARKQRRVGRKEASLRRQLCDALGISEQTGGQLVRYAVIFGVIFVLPAYVMPWLSGGEPQGEHDEQWGYAAPMEPYEGSSMTGREMSEFTRRAARLARDQAHRVACVPAQPRSLPPLTPAARCCSEGALFFEGCPEYDEDPSGAGYCGAYRALHYDDAPLVGVTGVLPGEHEDPAKRLALYKGFPIYLHKGNLRDENGAVQVRCPPLRLRAAGPPCPAALSGR